MMTISEAIRERHSVRTFDPTPLSDEEVAALELIIENLERPFDTAVDFRLLDAKEHGLESRVIVGASLYVAAKVHRGPCAELACGYAFEELCLRARQLGIGSVMLAASINRPAFERALHVGEDEVMPVASPLGHPAEKRSLRERAMRRGLKADARQPFETLFFEGSPGRALTPEAAGPVADALEAVRLAPSAVNKQPWRVVVCGDVAHFLERRTIEPSPLGDVQKVDIGIALAHFRLTLLEAGIATKLERLDASCDLPFELPGELEYCASCRL